MSLHQTSVTLFGESFCPFLGIPVSCRCFPGFLQSIDVPVCDIKTRIYIYEYKQYDNISLQWFYLPEVGEAVLITPEKSPAAMGRPIQTSKMFRGTLMGSQIHLVSKWFMTGRARRGVIYHLIYFINTTLLNTVDLGNIEVLLIIIHCGYFTDNRQQKKRDVADLESI